MTGLAGRFFLTASLFFLLFFSGCSIKETQQSKTDEEVLRDRVMAYWNYKINQDFDKSYAYEHPLYRKQTTMVQYIQGINTVTVKWLSAKVEKIKMEGDSASVDLMLRSNIRLPMMGATEDESLIQEKWLKVDDVWYHVPAKFREAGKGM